MRHEISFRQLPISSVPGHWIQVAEGGQPDGPTILFVHGASGSWHNWLPQLRAFAQTHRVVALDLRGHGTSPWPGGPGGVEDFFGDLVELVNQLPSRFDLVAHSFGGCLATLLATRHPERVKSLTLVNTAGHIPKSLTFKFLQLVSPQANLMLRYNNRIISTNATVSKHLVFRTLKEWDVWDLYPQVQCPAQVILGQFDPLIPVNLGREVARRIPDCRVRVLPAGGHVAMWEAATRLNGWLHEIVEPARASLAQAV